MAWIEIGAVEQADGALRECYDAAMRRSGHVAHIVRLMSPNPAVLRASMGMYTSIMFGKSPLSRSMRELLATVVSCANTCHY